jgi:hypothetical protein
MRKITRSAKSGRFVAALEAFRNPEGTVTETVDELESPRRLAPDEMEAVREACRYGTGLDVYITPFGHVVQLPGGQWLQIKRPRHHRLAGLDRG